MAENSNGWHFRRGLCPEFMVKLELLAKAGWFADVLADPDLILGIRDNYMKVYHYGQSIFKVEWRGKNSPLNVSTHPKYLFDPDLHKAIPFNGSNFNVKELEPVISTYKDVETLKRMKRAAKVYRRGEKTGVHAIARANESVIDTEVAFSQAAEEENKARTRRIDLASLDRVDGKIRLCFWEAKLFCNGELFAAEGTEPPVVDQVKSYRALIEKHCDEIGESYRLVSGNLVEIARWTRLRKVAKLVEQVAGGAAVFIEPSVGLIVYDYDDAEKKSLRWTTQKANLQKEMVVVSKGKAKDIKLRRADSD